MANDHSEVLAQIRNERERMARVERKRREHRTDLAMK
jgi:hypothetical protein